MSLQSRLATLINAIGADIKDLQTNPGLKPTAVKTANYMAANGEFVLMSGAHITSLPLAGAGKMVGVVNTDGNIGQTVHTTGASYIFGPGSSALVSIPLGTLGAYAIFVSNGTDWYIVGGALDTGWLSFGPLLVNGWTDISTDAVSAYRKIGNHVKFRGFLLSVSSTIIATIPPDHRPAVYSVLKPTLIGAGTFAYLAVASSGGFSSSSSGGNAFFIDSMDYFTD